VGGYTRQLECMSCSNSRGFMHYTETSSMPLSQGEALAMPPRSVIACARCGSTSLIRSWGDGIPYATAGYVGRRRRRRTVVVSPGEPSTAVR
jgi:hypothetical protein